MSRFLLRFFLPPPSLCFVPQNLNPTLPFAKFCRVLRSLIPITTRRAIRLSGQDPIHSAADGGQVECLRLLIQKGHDVNALLGTHISGILITRTRSKLYDSFNKYMLLGLGVSKCILYVEKFRIY